MLASRVAELGRYAYKLRNGSMMTVDIRPFADDDSGRLVEILRRNGQYGYPDVEGPEAMGRFSACEAAVFLVAESDGRVQGLIRAVYDGSRALIHLLSVDPDVQSQGIGRALLRAAEEELKRRGSPGAAATVAETSAGFWDRCGYGRTSVQLMLKPTFAAHSQT
jgi:ribosomal protein S18 acetylase RimI-like enzyme